MVHHPSSVLHFHSSEAYHKYLAHIHIHGESKGHHHPVIIAGRKHTVCHHCGSLYHMSHHHQKIKKIMAESGYDGIVTRKTIFMVGEHGPEHVTVIPLKHKGFNKPSLHHAGLLTDIKLNLHGIDGKPIGSHIGPIIHTDQLHQPNVVSSSKSPYAGRNDLIGSIMKGNPAAFRIFDKPIGNFLDGYGTKRKPYTVI